MKDGGDGGGLDGGEVDEDDAEGDDNTGGVMEESDGAGDEGSDGEPVTTGSAEVRSRCTGVRGGAASGNVISTGK